MVINMCWSRAGTCSNPSNHQPRIDYTFLKEAVFEVILKYELLNAYKFLQTKKNTVNKLNIHGLFGSC